MRIARVKSIKNNIPTGKSYRVYAVGDVGNAVYYELCPEAFVDNLRVTNVTETYQRQPMPVKATNKPKKLKKLGASRAHRRIEAHKQSMFIIKKGKPYNYKGDDKVKLEKKERSIKNYKRLESEVAELAKRF